MTYHHSRDLGSGGDDIVHQGGVEKLGVFIVYQLFIVSITDPHGYATVNLSLQDQRINYGSAIFDDNITLDLHHHCLWIYLEYHGMGAKGCATIFWAKVSRGFQAWFCARFDCATKGIRQGCQFT